MRSFTTTLTAAVLFGLAGAVHAADVLVLPFVDAGGNAPWVGKSIQQSLVGDVGRGGGFKPVTTPSTGVPSGDLAVAISAARQANVPYVVFGSYRVDGDQLHVTANAIDVEKMQLVGGVRVGRSKRDIFDATDALGNHVVGHLTHARGNPVDGMINSPANAVGASPISHVQMPLTSVPMSYVDWADKARPKTTRSSQFANLLPQTFVVDNPLEQIPDRLIAGGGRDPRAPFSNAVQSSDGNQVTRSDGNAVIGGDGTTITGGDGNTILRGDGNTMSYNRGDTIPQGRGFGNTMRFNRGEPTGATNVPGAGAGNSVNAPAGGAVRPQPGRAVQPGSGNAVQGGSGRAVNPNSGRAVTPQGQR